jgi:ADP-heptose:LPS heptosyltransferase
MDLAVVRLSSFGDIILTEPVTRALRAEFGDARIHFITGAEFAPVPALFDAVDEVVPWNRRGGNEDLGRVAAGVTFEAVLDLQNNIRSRRLCGRLRKRRLVRYRRQVLKRFLWVKMPWVWKGDLRHTIDLYGDALARLGVTLRDRVPRIEVGEDALARAGGLLGSRAGGGPVIAVCPGGSSEYKRWPEAGFAGLIDSLAASPAASGARIVLLGSEEDRRPVESVAARVRRAEPLVVVSADVALLAALLSGAAVTVTNDSGLMHLAAASGSRVAALFGPTSPGLGFAPLGPGHRVVALGLACSPCSYHGNRPCRLSRRVCMEDLTPAEVQAAVESILAGGAADA